MSGLAHHLLFALCAAALGSAALRLAAQLTPRGLERAVVAGVLSTAAACIESLALGLVDLGGSPFALGLAAVATWTGARIGLAPPRPSVGDQLWAWWRDSPRAGRIAVAAVAGAGLAWTAWLVRWPALGIDSVQYHVPEAVIWVQEGSPGASLPGILGPVTSLPLLSEVLLAWAIGLSRSLVPVSLLAPASMLLLLAAGWLGLRALGAGRLAVSVALGALCALPILTHYQMNGAYNDLPALALLVTAGALVAVSRKRPVLLAPALLAGAMAAGTKTTALPLTTLVLGIGFWRQRAVLRQIGRPLLLAAAAGLVLGGFWYLRDLVQHGSPFWPDVPAPWGDPSPVDAPSFLNRPRATLDLFLDDYLDLFAGGIALIGGALVVPLLGRRRELWWTGAVTAISVLLWLGAPATGAAESGSTVGTVSTLRYILPAVAASIVTLALATRAGGLAGAVAWVCLSAALGLSAGQSLDLGFPSVPGPVTLLGGAVVGALAAAALSALPARPLHRRAASALVAAAVVAAGLGLAAGADGWLERHAEANATTVYPHVAMIGWLAAQPAFRDGEQPVAMAPVPNGAVVGDRMDHDLELIPFEEPCARVHERSRRGWVLVGYLAVNARFSAARCLAGVEPAFEGPGFRVYHPQGQPRARSSTRRKPSGT